MIIIKMIVIAIVIIVMTNYNNEIMVSCHDGD